MINYFNKKSRIFLKDKEIEATFSLYATYFFNVSMSLPNLGNAFSIPTANILAPRRNPISLISLNILNFRDHDIGE